MRLKFSLMSVNYEEIITNSVIASAKRQTITMFIESLRFVIALGVVLSDIASCRVFLDFILFLNTSWLSAYFSSSSCFFFLSSSIYCSFFRSSSKSLGWNFPFNRLYILIPLAHRFLNSWILRSLVSRTISFKATASTLTSFTTSAFSRWSG